MKFKIILAFIALVAVVAIIDGAAALFAGAIGLVAVCFAK